MYESTGTCFIDSIRYGVLLHQTGQAKPEDRITVVHAICEADGGHEFVHAWAEHGGLAWQGAYEKGVPVYIGMPALALRKQLRARQVREYTLDEALEQATVTNHCGPWKSKLLRAAENSGKAKTSVSIKNQTKPTAKVTFGVPHGITDLRLQLPDDLPESV